jgi:predicted RNase H-related nuclease YkuK (DUF458 family)
MTRIFKHETTGEQVDPILHALEVIEKYGPKKKWDEELKIYVGTDSQNKRGTTIYACVIAFRYGHNGAHYIYTREEVDRIKDRHTRLWKEVELSLEIAMALRDGGVPVFRVELDFNELELARSKDLVAAGRGYVMGMNFDCEVKPECLCSCRAADHIVKKRRGGRRAHVRYKKHKKAA